MDIREIDSQLQQKINKAWEVRNQNFPSFIEFDYPTKTAAVSLTGNQCSLDCAHCGGHYLENMLTLDQLDNESNQEVSSCLISGGCDQWGKVDIASHLDHLKESKEDKDYNMHVGLVDEAEIDEISQVADVVSFDFVADQATIDEVYGLERTVEDYVETYKQLKQQVEVVPHICIGLKGGEIAGEYRALELLKELGVSKLAFIVFIPTDDTDYAECSPPALEEVLDILCQARIDFPQTPINLGCMRPKGKYRAELDYYAVTTGVNKIVIPTSYAIDKAKELGLEIEQGEECCAL
ncbi:MAG: radical SAM protein [Bacillota bacterium]